MTHRSPRVSIGVPVYNGARYLAEALDSLVGQTFEDIEIIISDNASSDETPDICGRYVQADPRVRYVRNQNNIGAPRNFARCLELARGEYFRWNSADDYAAPTLVEKCVAVLDADASVVQVYGRTVLVDGDGDVIEPYEDRLEAMEERPSVRYEKVMRNLGLVNGYYGLLRTDVLRRTGVHGPFAGADMVVQQEIALYGKIAEIPEPLFFRRMHREAQSAMDELDRARFYDPSAKHPDYLYHWHHLAGRLKSVARSPVALSEKLRLAGLILRGAVSTRDRYLAELASAVRRPSAGER